MSKAGKIKPEVIIGIDPGAAGGVAVKLPDGGVEVYKMPKDLLALSDIFKHYGAMGRTLVFLEKLSVRLDDLQRDGESIAMGKLHRIQKMLANYEHIKALLETGGVPYVMIHPLSWQSKLGLRKPGMREEKPERKRRYKEFAATKYPGVKVTLWNSDALLILLFGERVLSTDPGWVRSNLPAREWEKLLEPVE